MAHPKNLMAHRSQNKEVIKGALLLAAIILPIAALFVLSGHAGNIGGAHTLVCQDAGGGKVSCQLESE